MSESVLSPVLNASEPSFSLDGVTPGASGSDRRADVDARQARVAQLLQESQCEGLLALEPENFAWLSSGGAARSVLNPEELPLLYFSADQRWVLCSNTDTQRLFDEELDTLGFQLKEWPWHWGREQLLLDLLQGRKMGCDRPLGECKVLGTELGKLRRQLTAYEQACYHALGLIVAHALEATCRTMNPGETEREIAGQISHRLLHRGAYPTAVGVAADGRSKAYRQFGFTSAPIRKHAVLTVTARKYGFCVTASRSVCFGPPDPLVRKEHDVTCKVSATYVASTWPDAVPRQVLGAGRRVYQITGFEHEWLAAPQGLVSGRAPVELTILPQTADLFQPGWAVTWRSSAGAAMSCDTFIVTDKGPKLVTPTEVWPLKRIRIQGAEFVRPDLLQR
jgi:Xaa-Pro aminopeptidase